MARTRRRLLFHYQELLENGFIVLKNMEEIVTARQFIRMFERNEKIDLMRVRPTGEVVYFPGLNIGFSWTDGRI